MRHLFFALLVAAPTALVTWVIARGVYGEPSSRCATAGVTAAGDADAVLRGLLAVPIPGFSINGAMELYDEKGLFDYIDGAAPLYIERHFRKLAAAEMVVTGGGELTCDIYDMGAAENAASIYTAEATPQAVPAALGDAGRTSSMALGFREGPYYVKLTAFDAAAEAALPNLARVLLERMP